MEFRIYTAPADITPGEAGYRQDVIDRLDGLLLGLIRDNKLQCASYSLARGGKTFAIKSMGRLRHTEGSADFLPDSIRRIASITKWFTLVCIFRLMEEGKLSLVQAVKDWIHEFDQPAFQKITIMHLLTHTSGLRPDPGYFTEPYPFGWWDVEFAFGDHPGDTVDRTAEEQLAYRKSKWIKSMLSGPPVSEPGKVWNYSSAGFALLGEIIERASGMRYDEYFREVVTGPLGMTRTFFQVPEELVDQVCITDDWGLKNLTGEPQDRTGFPPRTGGGLYSTLHDLNRFGHMMLDGSYLGERIISRKSIELISRDQFPKGIPAYCWGADHKRFHQGVSSGLGSPADFYAPATYSHEGAGRSALLVDPEEQLVVVFFVPTSLDWVPESIINFKNMIWSGLQ